MDWTAERPKAKRLLFWQRNKKQNPFPVQNVSDENPKFIGYFTGLSVEVFDEEAIQIIYDNGCYGIGSRTKATPRIFTTINVAKRKCDFSDEFDNRKKSNTVDCDKSNDEPANDQSDFENVVRGLKVPKAVVDFDTEEQANDDLLTAPVPKPILDEFPIEKREKFTESLSLFPEEAFFLHHSLKCLTIIDIFENVELSTSAVLQKFCAIKSNFVTSFVAYQYYRSQNWVIKCGIKYAGDFLLYYKGPQYFHASYIVLVQEYTENHSLLDTKDMHGLYRLAETCKKDILFLLVKYPTDIAANDPDKCIENISSFRVLEMSPKRFTWSQARSTKH